MVLPADTVVTGTGFTVTCTFAVPEQPLPSVPVTVYPWVDAGDAFTVLPDVVLSPVAGDQVYPVPPVAVSGTDVPAQMLGSEGVAMITGFGFTVTVTVETGPVHPPREGVMVYVTVPAVVPDAVSVCVMLVPLPAVAPVAPVCDTVQVKVAPAGTDVSAMPVCAPEHTDCEAGVATTDGSGFTVTIASKGSPAQPASVGVML